ncbi:glycosyltransferase [Williamsia herbipolensis]|uniref:glycosyltransferase n=1 Tax=Williamsia herbipolensis TaxID=1603258 RepID=UPI0005F878A0
MIIGTRGYPSYYGGFETLVRRLGPYLVDNQWDLTVYGRPGAMRADDPDRDWRVTVRTTRGLESKSLSTISYGLSAAIDAALAGVDVALIMNVANGFWLPILKARGIRTVVNVDGIEWERAKWGRSARRVFRLGAKMTARYADELVFDAEAIKDYWIREFGRSGTFIPYGGEPDYPTLDAPKFEPGTYALMVARFVPENSIREFIHAVEMLEDQPVVVVGSSGYGGEFDEALKRLHESRDNVHWLGHVKDDALLFSLWENCGVYFHGHSVGGTNPALVQAMACGAPTIARDTSYNREVLGDAGRFVQPSPRAIADSIAELIADHAAQSAMAEASRERAKRHYSWESVCRSYSDLMFGVPTSTPAHNESADSLRTGDEDGSISYD